VVVWRCRLTNEFIADRAQKLEARRGATPIEVAPTRQQWAIPLDKAKASSIQAFGVRRMSSEWIG